MNELGSDIGFPAPRRSAEIEPQGKGDARATAQIDVADLLRLLLKWKWLILGAVCVGIAAAIGVTLASTRVYRASTTLDINTSPIEIMGSKSDVQPRQRNDDEYLQTEYGLLKSRSLAERVEQQLKLGDDPGFVSQHLSPQGRALAATTKLMAGLDVQPQRGSHLVTLYYRDVDPDRAMRIANAFGTGFIAAGAARRYDATAYARDFLQSRLATTREKLEASERSLVGYAQKQGILQLDEGNAGAGQANARSGDGPTSSTGDSLSSQSLTALNAALATATSERIAAKQRYDQALANPNSDDVLNKPAVQALRTDRNKLEEEYRQQLGTFQPDYPDMVTMRGRIAQIDQALANESAAVSSSLRSAYLAALGRESALHGQVDALRAQVLDLRGRGIDYTILQREVDTNRTLYDALLERFKQISIVGGLGESDAEVVDTALPPRVPFKPRPLRNLLFGLIAGLAGGLAIAFGIEFIDDTIKSPEDAKSKLRLPILGLVPRMPKAASMLDQLASPRSEIAEAYYSVMTALQFTSNNGYPRSLLVTSSRASEGKSSTALALAQNFARTGMSVLLIDADLRNPSFHAPESDSKGLSSLLITTDTVDTHVASTRTPHLSLLPSGDIPPSPAELLVSNRIHDVIRDATNRFDIVIVDAPPVLGLADAPMLGSACEATLLVIEAGSIRRRVVLDAVNRLTATDAHIVGAVLTKYNPKSAGYGYGYGYGYSYGSSAASGSRRDDELLDIAS